MQDAGNGSRDAPIFERRLSSSALRLKKPAGFAAMHLAVGIILRAHDSQGGCVEVTREEDEERRGEEAESCRMMSLRRLALNPMHQLIDDQPMIRSIIPTSRRGECLYPHHEDSVQHMMDGLLLAVR